MNTFDHPLVVEQDATIVFRDFVTGLDKLFLRYTGTDPNGVLSAPAGSLASGAAGLWENTSIGIGTVWSQIQTTATFCQAPNQYYIDTTAAATPVNAAFRIFPTIAAALAVINAGFPTPAVIGEVVLRLREGQTHLWDGTGLPAADDRTLTLFGAVRGATVSLSGTWHDCVNANLKFVNTNVIQSGDVYLGKTRALQIDKVDWDGGGNLLTMSGVGCSAQRSTWKDVRVKEAGGFVGFIFLASFAQCHLEYTAAGVAPIFFDGVGALLIANSTVKVTEDDFTFAKVSSISVPPLTVVDGDVSASTFVVDQAGAGAALMFDPAPAPGDWAFSGTFMLWRYPGGGAIDFGAISSVAARVSLMSDGVAPVNLPVGSWINTLNNIVAVP